MYRLSSTAPACQSGQHGRSPLTLTQQHPRAIALQLPPPLAMPTLTAALKLDLALKKASGEGDEVEGTRYEEGCGESGSQALVWHWHPL